MSTCQRLSSDAGRLTGLMHDCNRRSMILDLGGIEGRCSGGPPRLIRWREGTVASLQALLGNA